MCKSTTLLQAIHQHLTNNGHHTKLNLNTPNAYPHITLYTKHTEHYIIHYPNKPNQLYLTERRKADQTTHIADPQLLQTITKWAQHKSPKPSNNTSKTTT